MLKPMLFAGVCSTLLLFSCGAGSHDHPAHGDEHADAPDVHAEAPDAHAEGASHSDEIVLPAAKAEAAGVESEPAVPGQFHGVIKTGGQILPASGDEAMVAASAAGIVSLACDLYEGTPVKKGQPLFSLLSGNLQDGNSIGRARVAYEAARDEYERASRLVDSKIVSQKDFLKIRENYENARIAYEALRPNADGTGVSVTAPFDGYIKDMSVKEGDYVSTGAPMVTVAQDRRLVLKADLSQRYYGLRGEITSANFRTPYSEETFSLGDLSGRLVSSGRNVSGTSYYIPVTFEFDNIGKVVPGSFAEVWLLTRTRDNVISLPESAFTEEQGVHYVYIRIDEDCYRKQVVTLGESDGERTEVISGVSAGDNVVVKGACHVKLASASNVIPAHSHNH